MESMHIKRLARHPLWIVLLASTLWLACTAGLRSLTLPDEGRYGGIAWEMLSSGRFAFPLLDGMPFFHKPPLFYWLSALGQGLFGPNEWAVRLPSLLAGIASVAGLFCFLRRYQDTRRAALTAALLATQPFFFIGAQFANLDMLVAGLIALTILSGADAVLRRERDESSRGAMARTFVLAALAVLAKGLIGFLLPGGVLFCWILWRRSWRALPLLFHPLGWGLFLLLALPWFGWAQYRYAGFFDYFIVYHHIQRFTQKGFNNQMPFWFYLPVLLAFTLPWPLWLLRLLRRPEKRPAQGPVGSLMAIWLGLILLFFSLPSSKLVGYILPVLPPFAYFLALPFADWMENRPARARRWFGLTLALAMAICIALVFALEQQNQVSAKTLATQARSKLAATDRVAMVDTYQYDLPFYLQLKEPAWVVDNWDDPEIPLRDDWRKELYDAGRFDPAVAEAVLLTPPRFRQRLCSMEAGAVWLWARGVPPQFPWLQDLAPFGQDDKYMLWRLEARDLRRLPPCAGKPTGGS